MADETKIQPTAPSPPPRSPAAGGTGGTTPPAPPPTGGGGGGGGHHDGGGHRPTGSPDRPGGARFRAMIVAGVALLLVLLWVALGSGWLSNDNADERDVTPVTSGTGGGVAPGEEVAPAAEDAP